MITLTGPGQNEGVRAAGKEWCTIYAQNEQTFSTASLNTNMIFLTQVILFSLALVAVDLDIWLGSRHDAIMLALSVFP